MRTRALILIGAIFLLAPFHLGARSAGPSRVLALATSRVMRTTVKNVKVTAKVMRQRGALMVAMTAENPTKRAITTELKVDVFEPAPMSRMARMVPPPIHHGSRNLTIRLAPGQKVTKKIAIRKPRKSRVRASKGAVSSMYAVVRPAPRKRRS